MRIAESSNAMGLQHAFLREKSLVVAGRDGIGVRMAKEIEFHGNPTVERPLAGRNRYDARRPQLHHEPAIDGQDLAGDVTGFGTG